MTPTATFTFIDCQGSQTNGFSQRDRLPGGDPFALCHACMTYVSLEPALPPSTLEVLATHTRAVPAPPTVLRFVARPDVPGWSSIYDEVAERYIERVLPEWQAEAAVFVYNHLLGDRRIIAIDHAGTVMATYTGPTP